MPGRDSREIRVVAVTFRGALRVAEMPKQRIDRRTQAYHDAGSLRKMLPAGGIPR